MFETRYESIFVSPTKVLSEMSLSEGIPSEKPCADPQALDQTIIRANFYENEVV